MKPKHTPCGFTHYVSLWLNLSPLLRKAKQSEAKRLGLVRACNLWNVMNINCALTKNKGPLFRAPKSCLFFQFKLLNLQKNLKTIQNHILTSFFYHNMLPLSSIFCFPENFFIFIYRRENRKIHQIGEVKKWVRLINSVDRSTLRSFT